MAAWDQAAGLADTWRGGCPMRIERRDPTLTYPRAIREDKRRLVLDWLLEFQFSSVELLAQRLGLTSHSSYKFFRALLDDQLIQHVKSVHTHQGRGRPVAGRRPGRGPRPHPTLTLEPIRAPHARPGRATRRAQAARSLQRSDLGSTHQPPGAIRQAGRPHALPEELLGGF